MMRGSSLRPIERFKKVERLVSPLAQGELSSGGPMSQKLKGTFRGCITQKVKSRVQATRLQHLKYIEGKGTCTKE